MQFHLVTGFAKSESSIMNTIDNVTGQGVLQGSSSTAPIFILNSDVSLTAYKKLGTGVVFTHPITGKEIVDHAVQFVDDSSQFLNYKGINLSESTTLHGSDLQSCASHNAQTWSDLLWVSGGQLNLGKCYYYAFKPSLNYKSNKIIYTKIVFDQGIQVKSKLDGTSHIIQAILPNEARCTLGVMLSQNGDGSSQIMSSITKAKEFFSKFINCSMSQKTKWVAINSVIEPSIIYPLLTSYFTPKQIQPIDSMTSQMKCLTLGRSQKFPRAILHGPLMLGGMGIPSTTQKNTKDRLNNFLYNIHCPSSLTLKLELSMIYSQIESGSFLQFFRLPFQSYGHLLSPFYMQLWSELEPMGLH
jgi:hypothetical protein